jgi:nucleotide-binding universal stress UspA family protein
MPAIEKILIATDGSRNVERAIDYAIKIADISGAKLVALYVVNPDEYEPAIKYTGRDVVDLLYKRGEEAIQKVKLEAELKKIPCEGVVLEGNPAKKIVEFAKEKNLDLIVMGTMGRSGISKFMIGSVAEKVVRTSPVPVLTVRSK